MKRTTVSLPEDLLRRALAVCRRRGISLGAFVRDAVQRALDGDQGWDQPHSVGCADSGGAARGRDLDDMPEAAFGAGPG